MKSITQEIWQAVPNEDADGISLDIRDGNGFVVAQLPQEMYVEPISEMDWRHGRLMAAAPELLSACQRILRAINWSATEDRQTREEMVEILRAAIAKAEGGAP